MMFSTIVAITLLLPLPLWWLFLAVMNLARADAAHKLSPHVRKLGTALTAGALVIDMYLNLVLGTLVFLQLPNYRRLTLSARMDDLIRNHSGWRRALATYIVGTYLEPFDTAGGHSTHGRFP